MMTGAGKKTLLLSFMVSEHQQENYFTHCKGILFGLLGVLRIFKQNVNLQQNSAHHQHHHQQPHGDLVPGDHVRHLHVHLQHGHLCHDVPHLEGWC